MLEEATWTRANRRHFAIVKQLYDAVGLDLETQDFEATGWENENELAASLAHRVGSLLLGGSIMAGTSDRRRFSSRSPFSKRRQRGAWQSVTPERGARASVYLTLAAAAMVSKEVLGEEDLDSTPVEYGRNLVQQAYGPPKGDLEAIEIVRRRVIEQRNHPITKEATKRGGTLAFKYLATGQTTLSFQALELAGADPAGMPAYREVAGVDQSDWAENVSLDWLLVADVRFASFWSGAKDRFLDIVFAATG